VAARRLSGALADCMLPAVKAQPESSPPPGVAERQNIAGRAGFALGCLAFAITSVLNLMRAPRPLSLGVVILSLLIAALNIPLGIGLALLVERLTRSPSR
jgi:hypothetical protein